MTLVFIAGCGASRTGGSAPGAGTPGSVVDHVPARSSPFVEVRDSQFFVSGAPVRITGANVAVMVGPDQRATVDEVLDAVAEDGHDVIRLWAVGEAPRDAEPWRRDFAFRFGPTGFIEESYAHLDRVLAAAAERGLRVIVVLANRWHNLGGMPEYLRWAGDREAPPLGEDVEPTALGRFYGCSRCDDAYRSHVLRLVERVNRVTGRRYRDDPTIFSWELFNEASAHTARDAEALRTWVTRQATFIKAHDPNHLVGAGLIGYRTLLERAVFRRVQSIGAIDYCDVHAYPDSEERLNPAGHLDPELGPPTPLLAAYIDDRVFLSSGVLGKPLLFGEVGFARTAPNRARRFERFADLVDDAGGAGLLTWIYSAAVGETPRRHGVYTGPGPGGAFASDATRQALRRVAQVFDHTRPLAHRFAELGDDAILDQARHEVRGVPAELRWRPTQRLGAELSVPLGAFERASFRRTGLEAREEDARAHFWGEGDGTLEFLLPALPQPPRRLRIQLRISSERPGRPTQLSAEEGSRVVLSVGDVVLGAADAPADDGAGETRVVTVDDPQLLGSVPIGETSTFSLRLAVEKGGLCLYDEHGSGLKLVVE